MEGVVPMGKEHLVWVLTMEIVAQSIDGGLITPYYIACTSLSLTTIFQVRKVK